MARPAKQSFAKRQREKKRDEKRKEKEEKKRTRKLEKEQDPTLAADDIVDASAISPFLAAPGEEAAQAAETSEDATPEDEDQTAP